MPAQKWPIIEGEESLDFIARTDAVDAKVNSQRALGQGCPRRNEREFFVAITHLR